MMNSSTMVLPRNAVIMQDNEMRYIEGGAWKIIVGLCSASIWNIGYNAKTSYSKTFTRSGKRVKVSYTPSKKLVKFGNITCYVGNWGLKEVYHTVSIASGIKGFVKVCKQ